MGGRKEILKSMLAVLLGALAAVLVATLIIESIKNQRVVHERDEASGLALYLKDLLAVDATCTPLLRGKTFKADAPFPLQLEGASLMKGLQLEGGLKIEELTLQSLTPDPLMYTVRVGGEDRKVARHLVRMKLQLANYRARFFDFPVIVGGDVIEGCSNEIGIGDACQSMGFKWDTLTNPPSCIPHTACAFGGLYTIDRNGGCKKAHPMTRECACPRGFRALAIGAVNIKGARYDSVVQCYRCP